MSKPSELYGKPWTESDYLIVLHYYIENRAAPRHIGSDYVIEAAKLIGRTPAAVLMRMENFASLDPAESLRRTGLININDRGRRLFQKWFEKGNSLRDCAEVLIREVQSKSRPTLFDPEPIRMPKAFGKYDLLDPVGDGGFGSVYSCLNSDDGQVYALKIIKPDTQWDSEIVHRFRREIHALKSVNHPRIIRIHDDNLDSQPTYPAFIMDYAKCSLTKYLEDSLANEKDGNRRPRLPNADSIRILFDVLDGVHALHNHVPVVIHRDINPGNILLMADGSWVLADFSLAKFLPRALVTTTFATASRQAWGTHGYSAPEQFQDFKLADERADIYSLGVLIWELLSPAWPPFDRACLLLPGSVERVVLKATERERQNRYGSVGELRSELEHAIQN